MKNSDLGKRFLVMKSFPNREKRGKVARSTTINGVMGTEPANIFEKLSWTDFRESHGHCSPDILDAGNVNDND